MISWELGVKLVETFERLNVPRAMRSGRVELGKHEPE